MNPRLPDFVIIGAVKAATTWLGAQLRAQPGTFLPDPEPHYFSTEFGRGEAWYASLFAPAGAATRVGEKSADYLAHPEAPQRLAARLPDAKLIVLFREPVARAYSDYCMLFRRGTVDGDIVRHLSPGAPEPRFLNDGLYFRHLSRWLAHVDAGQIHVLLQEDIRGDPAAALNAVGRHIGLPEATPVAPDVRRNDSQAPLLPLPLRRTLAPLKPAVEPLRGQPWFERLRSSLARPAAYPPLPPDLARRLADFYAADTRALAGLIGRDLSPWLAREPCAA